MNPCDCTIAVYLRTMVICTNVAGWNIQNKLQADMLSMGVITFFFNFKIYMYVYYKI